jgi:hypothetical protein
MLRRIGTEEGEDQCEARDCGKGKVTVINKGEGKTGFEGPKPVDCVPAQLVDRK